jgi:signal recognition particle subunit SRP54
MVLAELGGKLRESLRKLHASQGHVDQDTINTLLSEVSRALIESDVNVKLVMKLRDSIKQKVSSVIQDTENTHVSRLVQKIVVEELTALLTPDATPHKLKRGKPNVVLFVGLQGAGKTTSIAKYANYYQRRGWKTAMVCADTFRAGAFDQLKQNATKLRVPFYGSYTEPDPVVLAEQGVKQFKNSKYEVIIVDTSGRHKQEAALFEEMQEIAAAVKPDNTIFVMDATQGQAVYDQALGFHDAVDVGAVIVTKLDGHAKGGGALSAVAATHSPIVFLGSGEHFDDFDPFHAQSFVSKLLGFGDMRGFMEEMKEVNEGKSSQELMDNIKKGQYTLRDMYKQFENTLKIGPLNKVMGMMPGMPEHLIPKSGDDEGTRRLKVFMYIMDSMNDAELDGKVDLHKKGDPAVESRIRRIAKGSGTHPMQVQMLLTAHHQFEGMVHKMGKSGMMKGGPADQKKIAAQMRKNPNQVMQRINQMDPRMLQQMGGSANVMQMMQSMAKGGGGSGGMPDMEALMQSMGGMGGGMPPGMGMPSGGGMPPGMSMPPGGAAGMPNMAGMDMNAMAQMMQQMGMGGAPPRR